MGGGRRQQDHRHSVSTRYGEVENVEFNSDGALHYGITRTAKRSAFFDGI